MSEQLKLTDREWRTFAFNSVFDIVDGYYNNKPPVSEVGNFPFLGATQYDNGITGFTTKEDVRYYDKVGGHTMLHVEKRFYRGGCIAITNNGSVGHAYYQSGPFTCSHDITVVYLKNQILDRALALFLIPLIEKTGESFVYAKKWRPKRMRRSMLILPITPDGTPDWNFMSAYMRQEEKVLMKEAISRLKRQLAENHAEPVAFKGREWRAFFIEDLATIDSGIRLTKADMKAGETPFVGASEMENGVTSFVSNKNESRDKDVLGVNYNGSVCYSFYHPYEALFSDDVKRIKLKDRNAHSKYTLLFLSVAIAGQKEKYAYGYKFNSRRMKRQLLMLPVTPDGTPDWAFMSAYMQSIEREMLREALDYFKEKFR